MACTLTVSVKSNNRRSKPVRSFLAGFLAFLALAPVAAWGEGSAVERLHQLLADDWEARLEDNPLFASYVGDRRYEHLLPEVGEEAIHERAGVLKGFRDRLGAIDRDLLSREDRLTYDVFAAMLGQDLASIEHRDYFFPLTNRDGFHVFFARLADEMVFRKVSDYESYVARLEGARRYMDQHVALLERAIEEGYTLPRVVLDGYERTIDTHLVDDSESSVFYAPFESFPETIAEADRERLRAAGERAIAESVVPGYRAFSEFFKTRYLPATRETIGASELPGGEAFYAHRVRLYTSLDTTPREVHEIGEKEVARIRAEMEAVMAEAGFEGSFEEFLAFLRTDERFYAKTPEGLLKEAAWISKRMDGELPRLFGRLPRAPYGLEEIPADIAPKTTGAYYSQPAGDGTRGGTYFLNTYDLPSRPLYVLEALSLHEAVPGHHLQLALQQELDLPPFRRFYQLGAFVEGWALYSERLGLEVGFYQDPYSNFGRLTYEMWRACRLVVDTGIHAFGWDRQRAIDFLASNTALSIHEVTTEIDRYISWPGQALGYKMGELEIRRLRALAEEELGESFDLRAFHDEVLGNGSLPLAILSQEIERWIAEQKTPGGSAP